MKEQNREWLSTAESLQFLMDNGKIITKIGLKYIGMLYGFRRKTEDDFHVEYSLQGLKNYLKTIFPPKNYLTVSKISEKYKIEKAIIYKFLNDLKIEYEVFNGLRYIKPEDVQKIIDLKKYKDIEKNTKNS